MSLKKNRRLEFEIQDVSDVYGSNKKKPEKLRSTPCLNSSRQNKKKREEAEKRTALRALELRAMGQTF